MKIIMLGPQGSGKGTQAKKMSEKFNIPHISTGDIFRDNIKNQTSLGKKVIEYTNKGQLVPDSLTNQIVEDRIGQEDCKKGFILDGFPRTLPQAEALDKMTDIDHAVLIDIPDDNVVHRLEGRRTCSQCGAIFNVNTAPKPKDSNFCDVCGARLMQRDDDKEDAIRKRLEEYHEKTSPLIEHYFSKLIKIDGTKDINEVTQDIFKKVS